jgi:hypothetical protein
MSASAATHVKRCLRAAQPGAIPVPAPAPDFERHQRKCAICHHPDREAIEELFIYWHSADSIRHLFNLPDWSTMYRHARAAGLYERRRHNVRAVLEHLLEGVDGVEPTPMSIVSAVRAYACLTDSGGWVEPTKRLLLTTSHVSKDSSPPAAPPLANSVPATAHENRQGSRDAESSRQGTSEAVPESNEQRGTSASEATHSKTSNRQSPELELPVSHSKQRTGPLSNRQIPPHVQRELPLAQKSAAKVPKR